MKRTFIYKTISLMLTASIGAVLASCNVEPDPTTTTSEQPTATTSATTSETTEETTTEATTTETEAPTPTPLYTRSYSYTLYYTVTKNGDTVNYSSWVYNYNDFNYKEYGMLIESPFRTPIYYSDYDYYRYLI